MSRGVDAACVFLPRRAKARRMPASVAPNRASRSEANGAKRPAPREWTGLCFMAPLLAFLALVYVVPFLGVARMERHAAEARRRTI